MYFSGMIDYESKLRDCCNIYLHKTDMKLKSHETTFANHLILNGVLVLKIFREQGSDTAVLCAKLQSNWATEADVMDEQVFTRF